MTIALGDVAAYFGSYSTPTQFATNIEVAKPGNGLEWLRTVLSNTYADNVASNIFYWNDLTLPNTRCANTTSTSSTATIITLNGGTNAPLDLVNVSGAFSVLRVASTGEVMQLASSVITSTSQTTTVTVTRGALSSTNAVIPANTEIFIDNAASEGQDFTNRDASQYSVNRFNVTQLFADAVSLSGSSQRLYTVANEGKMTEQQQRLMLKQLKALQTAAIMGTRISPTGTTRRMGGLLSFPTLYPRVAGTATTTGALRTSGQNIVSLATVTINQGMIDDILEEAYMRGADPNQMVIAVSPRQRNQLIALKATRVNAGTDQGTPLLNNIFDEYQSSVGKVKILTSADIPGTNALFYQMDKVKVHPAKDSAFEFQPLAKTGDSDRMMCRGEYTVCVRNAPEHVFLLQGLA